MTEPTPSTAGAASRAARPAPAYVREVPGFGTVAFRVLDPEGDAGLVHRWVDDERARFWGMVGHTVDQVRDIYAFVDSLETHHAYLIEHDGRPAGLLQTYDPEHDPLGEHYPVRPGDFGIHILLAPPEGAPRSGFGGSLFGAVLDFVWSDPARLRVVAEPDVRNERSRRRLRLAGFTEGAEVALEHKRARLYFLERDRDAGPAANGRVPDGGASG
ncbi:GNAT family N-acetyltransferase [Streptomyces chilikensis]|uniref:Lysine N-acyltransferase MbtK n=1 Tax=Streptomyces chilikensis TaxID=1194079 RepID=A0ABV3ELZ6_9ACTN